MTPQASGTEKYRLIPKISRLAARPANSAAQVPRLVTRRASMMSTVVFTPYSSRMRSERPLPVTTPSRATISCTMTSSASMGTKDHSRA